MVPMMTYKNNSLASSDDRKQSADIILQADDLPDLWSNFDSTSMVDCARHLEISIQSACYLYIELGLRTSIEHETIAQDVLHNPTSGNSVLIDPTYLYVTQGYYHYPECDYYSVSPSPTFIPAGNWKNTYTGVSGQTIMSLVAKYIGIASINDLMTTTAHILGIQIDKGNKSQIDKLTNHTWVKEAHAHHAIEDDIVKSWDNLNIKYSYCFKTEFANESFWLFIALIEGAEVPVFYTLQCNERDKVLSWLPVVPPFEEIIFNRHLIAQYPQKELHIHDDIHRAFSCSNFGAINTWAGDISFYDKINWNIMKERQGKVVYVYDSKNADSYYIGFYLFNQLQKLGVNLEIIAIS